MLGYFFKNQSGFLTRLTHQYLAATRKADAIYLKFFEDISRDATLNKTVLIFLSDHGIRFGAVRQTSVIDFSNKLFGYVNHAFISIRSNLLL
jgi:membrane-anchored protein YejM (alkaline phosphatase superfamily)